MSGTTNTPVLLVGVDPSTITDTVKQEIALLRAELLNRPGGTTELAAIKAQLEALPATITSNIVAVVQQELEKVTPELVNQVVAHLLTGKGLAGLPDDMGLPTEFQLGQPVQNYFVWSGMMGATRALQSPENLLFIAFMLDAMAKAGAEPGAKIAAGKTALENVKRTLRG